MKFYYIKDDYIKFLRTYDSKVMDNKNQNRPYIGTIIEVNGISYFAPLSSPKNKHLFMKEVFDIFKLDDGKLGVINLNNMIPVNSENLIDLIVDEIKDEPYRNLLIKQIIFINKNETKIQNKAMRLRSIILSTDNNINYRNIRNRSCNLSLLENIYQNYKQK